VSLPHPDKVRGCAKGDGFLAAVAANQPSLQHIDLENCDRVTDSELAQEVFLTSHQQINSLYVFYQIPENISSGE